MTPCVLEIHITGFPFTLMTTSVKPLAKAFNLSVYTHPTKKLVMHTLIVYENGRTTVMELPNLIEQGSYIFECLNIGDTVEDDIKTARQYPRLVWLSSHGVRLARVGDTIGKQQTCKKHCQMTHGI